jgi:hypothetical protein
MVPIIPSLKYSKKSPPSFSLLHQKNEQVRVTAAKQLN